KPNATFEAAKETFADATFLVFTLGLLFTGDAEHAICDLKLDILLVEAGKLAVIRTSFSVSSTSLFGQPIDPKPRSMLIGPRSKPRNTSSNIRFISRCMAR